MIPDLFHAPVAPPVPVAEAGAEGDGTMFAELLALAGAPPPADPPAVPPDAHRPPTEHLLAPEPAAPSHPAVLAAPPPGTPAAANAQWSLPVAPTGVAAPVTPSPAPGTPSGTRVAPPVTQSPVPGADIPGAAVAAPGPGAAAPGPVAEAPPPAAPAGTVPYAPPEPPRPEEPPVHDVPARAPAPGHPDRPPLPAHHGPPPAAPPGAAPRPPLLRRSPGAEPARVVPAVDEPARALAGGVPAAEAPGTAAPGAGAAPPPDRAPLLDGLVDRIVRVVEEQARLVPPRTVVVEMEGDRGRLAVSLRGTEIHLAWDGLRAAPPELRAFQRAVAAALTSRGFDVGGDGPEGRSRRDPPRRRRASPRPAVMNRRHP